MNNHAWIRVLVFSLCFSTSLSQAASSSSDTAIGSTSQDSTENMNLPRNLSGWRLFGGVGGGYGSVQGNEFSRSPDGTEFLLGLHLSYQIKRWEFETGADWLYSRSSGVDAQNLPISIRTRSGFLNFSPRYRITNRWQLGPVVNLAFGTDTGFAPQVLGSSTSTFLGLKGVYEFDVKNFPVQFWAQLSTDVSIPNRQVVLALTGIQIGFPFSARSQDQSETIRYTRAAALKTVEAEDELIIILDPQKVFFNTNSSQLKESVLGTLAELGRYLKENPEQVGRMDVSGHADQRGAYAYNLKLSKKRSQSVRQALLDSGMSPHKVSVHAFSFSKPLDPSPSRKAWAKNRRVEIVFHRVLRTEPLKEILRPLMAQQPDPAS